jgi:hypothetical protein
VIYKQSLKLFSILHLHRDDKLPSLEYILLLRKSPESYFVFYDSILTCAVGKIYWKKTAPAKLATEVATPSDEALTLLILGKSWKTWKQEANLIAGETVGDGRNVKTKWTSNVMSAGKYEGWGSERVPRYNNLSDEVRDDRETNKEYDQDYQCAGGKKRKKSAAIAVVPSYNDLYDCGIIFTAV